jgi:predicted phosphoribosyltransferase
MAVDGYELSMASMHFKFVDRTDAGRQLAARLVTMGLDRPIVYALPRGGVPVALEIARALHAPLDLILVRKIGAPGAPEVALGAVVEGEHSQTTPILSGPASANLTNSNAAAPYTWATVHAAIRRDVRSSSSMTALRPGLRRKPR